MLRTRTDLLRAALFTTLGLFPNGCGRRTESNLSSGGSNALPPPASALAAASAVVSGEAKAPRVACGTGAVDPLTRLSRCDNGVLHRSSAPQCTSLLPRPQTQESAALRFKGGCKVDADCVEHPHGYCDAASDGQVPALHCNYGCVRDDDCGAGFACLCGAPVGRCVSASCRSDDDCQTGMLCAAWHDLNVGCSGATFLSCQTPADECATDADCSGGRAGSFCSAKSGVRHCVESLGIVCGRPFLVEGHARLADWVSGVDWCDAEPSLGAAHLSPAERQLLGAGWAEIALMEHASIAAFARFTLQLLHVGAPSELVAASQQAMLDETAHARACFTLASGFLGHGVSAGKLPMENALDGVSLPDMVRLVIREGCVGETVAALEAAEAWAYAELAEIREVLAKIRVDELRHAELAWQFVRWALATGDDAVREAATQEFAAVAAESREVAADAAALNTQPVNTPPFDTLPYGLVPVRLRAQLRTAALRDIVLPCSAAVLAAARRAPVARVDAALAL